MAKKTTKPVQRSQKGRDNQLKRMATEARIQEPSAPVATMERPAETPARVRPAGTPARQALAAHEMSRAQEYKFIKSDLQRVAILAVGVFAVLGALTFVIK